MLGCIDPSISRWGLNRLLADATINEYIEPELRCRCLVTDDDGTPIHPDTRQRTVKICPEKVEFILNLLFFFTYPVAVCCRCMQSTQSNKSHENYDASKVM